VRRHARRVQQLGGLLLLMVGTALVSGLWGDLIGWLRGSIAGFISPI
jgi:cytochrome c-type biogenesis protein